MPRDLEGEVEEGGEGVRSVEERRGEVLSRGKKRLVVEKMRGEVLSRGVVLGRGEVFREFSFLAKIIWNEVSCCDLPSITLHMAVIQAN